MLVGLDGFAQVWVADFEFYQPDGDRPEPLCMVARELRTGRTVRLWGDEMVKSPIPTGANVLFVAYYASVGRSFGDG